MSVKVSGKNELLSGHYQDIIISKNSSGDFQVKIRGNELYERFYNNDELDNDYIHFNYNAKTDEEKINNIIEYYLNNNTIFMISESGELKYHSGEYSALNAYYTYTEGYVPVAPALYLKNSKTFNKTYDNKKLVQKYSEDRIRHLDKILKCKEIIIDINFRTSSYYIKRDKAYINVACKHKKHKFGIIPFASEIEFLKQLIIEFLRQNEVNENNVYYPDNTVEIHNDDYSKKIIFNDNLMDYVLDARNEYYRSNKELDNITIDEYMKEKEKTLNLIKK